MPLRALGRAGPVRSSLLREYAPRARTQPASAFERPPPKGPAPSPLQISPLANPELIQLNAAFWILGAMPRGSMLHPRKGFWVLLLGVAYVAIPQLIHNIPPVKEPCCCFIWSLLVPLKGMTSGPFCGPLPVPF